MNEVESLRHFMEGVLGDHSRSAFVDSKGHVYGGRSDYAPDFGSFGPVAQSIQTYLQLKPWEVALTNDPFSGAPHQGQIYFVLGLPYSGKSDLNKEAQWCLVVGTNSPFYNRQLRIPPTPLGTLGQLNSDLINAINAQFEPNEGFRRSMDKTLAFFEYIRSTWAARLKIWKANPSKLALKAIGHRSSEVMQNTVAEMPWGESTVEWMLHNTRIRLRTEVRDGRILFDFTGTADDAEFAIPLVTTQGTAWAVLMIATKKNLWFSSDALGSMTVVAPKNTVVNASNNAMAILLPDGAEFIGPILLQGLGKIWPQIRSARPGGTRGYFEVHFQDRRVMTGCAPGGAPASYRRRGEDATPMFSHPATLRMELLEAKYPVRFHSYGIRRDSGGAGQFEGGDGGQISIEFLEDAKVMWWILDGGERPLGENGGLAASPAEVFTRAKINGDKNDLPLTGELDVKASMIWTLLAPGGGGYGEKPTPN